MNSENEKTETLKQGMKFKKNQNKIKCKKSNYINTDSINKNDSSTLESSTLEGFTQNNIKEAVNQSSQMLQQTNLTDIQLTQLQDIKSQFQSLLQHYESLSNTTILETNRYISNANSTKMKNVYVNSVVNNPSSKYIGSYIDDNKNSSLNTSLWNNGAIYNAKTCEEAAINNGYKYFGLQNYNPSTQTANCSMTNDLGAAESLGVAGTDTVCSKSSDGNIYGSFQIIDSNGNPTVPNAVYKVPDAKYIGTYGDNPNRAMNLVNGGSQTYTYKTCKQEAINSGSSLFALQDFNSSTQTAQCALSNDFSKATQYGTTTNYTTGNDGNIYGGGWANSIYQVNNNASYTGCYKDNTNTPAMTQATTNTSGTSNVFVSCGVNAGPWGSLTSFPDQSAVWIWYTANSQSNAPENPGNPVYLMYEYNNISTQPMNATIYLIVDNIGDLYVNSTTIGSFNGNWGNLGSTPATYSITLNPGYNNITVGVQNLGGPAGLLATCLNSSSQVLFNSNSAWTYSSNMKSSSSSANSFTYDTCLQTALNSKSKYFGLKGSPGNARCYLSNELQEVTQYGPALPSVSGPGGYQYGNVGINALYNVNVSGNVNNIGNVGYVNESGILSQYPSSMITQGNTYAQMANTNNPGNDWPNAPFANYTVDKCQSLCNASNSCLGFVYDTANSLCWPKTKLSLSNNVPSSGNNTYFRNVSLKNSDTCSKNVIPIDSVTWESYKKTGNQMTPSTLCGLAKKIQPNQEELNKIRGNLAILADKILSMTNQFREQNNNLNVQSNTDTNILNDSLKQYQEISVKFSEFKKYGSANINGILSDTNIKVLQNNYNYIFWSILAILLLIVTGFLIKSLYQ